MSDATIIYPHQLFSAHPAVVRTRPIYLVEEPLLLTHNPIHRQRLILHKLSLDAYERTLINSGHTVTRLSIHDHPHTDTVFARLQQDGVTHMHIVDTTDTYLERAIASSPIPATRYPSPLFLLSKSEAMNRYHTSKRRMALFYKQLRIDRAILCNPDGSPQGGAWSFDAQNRKKLPTSHPAPLDPQPYSNRDIQAAITWATTVPAQQYGEAVWWLPYTHTGAHTYLEDFLTCRFGEFGTYEDALSTRGFRLFHSTLSPLINIGLITPQEVLECTLAYATAHSTPINSVEGFVRQILGWREFMRAAYEVDGTAMRTGNFWKHTQTLPPSFWHATTTLPPLDLAISRAHRYGYTHHIERLMVLGNAMLLCEIHPREVYRWFMAMYVDAYDWVMVPNVYAMSQFADGGSFATKPYISGASYIKKMSDYPSGDWEEVWTALYWRFIAKHRSFFETNPRLAMMPRLLDRLDEARRAGMHAQATAFLQSLR